MIRPFFVGASLAPLHGKIRVKRKKKREELMCRIRGKLNVGASLAGACDFTRDFAGRGTRPLRC